MQGIQNRIGNKDFFSVIMLLTLSSRKYIVSFRITRVTTAINGSHCRPASTYATLTTIELYFIIHLNDVYIKIWKFCFFKFH